MQRPTMAELNNDNDAVKDQLLLLRILNTSDLTFLYMLYTKDTLKNIARIAMDLLMSDPDHGLNKEEFAEFHDLVQDIIQHANDAVG